MTSSATRYATILTVAPGLESLLSEELSALGLNDGQPFHGGITLRMSAEELWRTARMSRIAEGIRVRVGRGFSARNFQALQEGIGRQPWAAYIHRGQDIQVKVTCHKSRLMHTKAIEERVRAGIEARLTKRPPMKAPKRAATVLVRLFRDQVQLSVDAAGERLHKRGWRQHLVRGSLRETLAAACLRAAGLSGPTRKDTVLWDPFCGAGTILLEAATSHSVHPTRRFAFEDWPSHDAESYGQFCAQAHEASLANESMRFIGSDRDQEAIASAQRNLDALKMGRTVSLVHGDFNAVIETIPQGAALVTNLPYGRQVHVNLHALYRNLGKLLRSRPDLGPVAVLSADQETLARITKLPWELKLRFTNGGLPVYLHQLQARVD